MPIKAVIFDLDGTITKPHLDFDAIRRDMGLPPDSGPILESMQKMTPQQHSRAEAILFGHEQTAVAESKLNEGVEQTLRALRRAGIHIGILTRNKRSNALAVARKHGLKFDAVVDREDGPTKPDAFGVLKLCRRFEVEPSHTMLVGDYLFDLLSAKAAGAVAVLLKNHQQADEFTQHADFCIENIREILQIINENQ
ncbi:MAG: HAD family hydrolase [Sedimentisphaerales bacterium]|nr:HAD family hydrolase [Sedimentisphaerales bacterium]